MTPLATSLESPAASTPHLAGRRILFLGTHGQANVGDELLLDTFLTELGTQHHYTVNSYDPDATRAQLHDRFDIDVFDTAGSRIDLLRKIWGSDVVIFGGGSIIKELYRSVGRWRYSTLAMVLAMVIAARLVARRPVALSNVGVGPIDSKMGRRFAKVILKVVDVASVRDCASFDLCREVGMAAHRLRLVPDAVWVRDAESLRGSAPSAQGRAADGVIRIALNLNKDVEDADGWETFLDQLVQALSLLAETTPIEIHALPMQSSFKADSDLDVLTGVLDRVGAPSVLHQPTTHQEVAAIIDACDVVVSERFHAIVMAAVLGTAVVALPYDIKVRQLVSELGLGAFAHGADASLDGAALAASIIDCFEQRQAESARLVSEAASLRRRSAASFDALRAWLNEPRRQWPDSTSP